MANSVTQSKQDMESPASQQTQLMLVAQNLGDLRDSLMHVSMALKDYMADTPSSARDEAMAQMAQTLARIQQRTRGGLE